MSLSDIKTARGGAISNGGTKKLGWYAAYTKDTSKGPVGQTRTIDGKTADAHRLNPAVFTGRH